MAQTSRIRSRRVRVLTVSEGGCTASIMIGPVRGPEHLALIRRLGFYHVPVSAIAASRTAVVFVAFYEGASRFQGTTGVIREYAEILHVSRVPRRDLPELTWPGRGGEDASYYRFDLGEIHSLPHPITNPDRLRVVFRFPDLQRFQRAATIRDLGASQTSEARSGSGRCAPRPARNRKEEPQGT